MSFDPNRPKIFDPCTKCGADAWCNEVKAAVTKTGAPNPFFGKWLTWCKNCQHKRNYDTPPPSKPRNYLLPTPTTNDSNLMDVSSAGDGSRMVQLSPVTVNAPSRLDEIVSTQREILSKIDLQQKAWLTFTDAFEQWRKQQSAPLSVPTLTSS